MARPPSTQPSALASSLQVSLCAPVPRPPSVIGIGKNYLDHVKEMDKSLPTISKPSTPADAIIFTKARPSPSVSPPTLSTRAWLLSHVWPVLVNRRRRRV